MNQQNFAHSGDVLPSTSGDLSGDIAAQLARVEQSLGESQSSLRTGSLQVRRAKLEYQAAVLSPFGEDMPLEEVAATLDDVSSLLEMPGVKSQKMAYLQEAVIEVAEKAKLTDSAAEQPAVTPLQRIQNVHTALRLLQEVDFILLPGATSASQMQDLQAELAVLNRVLPTLPATSGARKSLVERQARLQENIDRLSDVQRPTASVARTAVATAAKTEVKDDILRLPGGTPKVYASNLVVLGDEKAARQDQVGIIAVDRAHHSQPAYGLKKDTGLNMLHAERVALQDAGKNVLVMTFQRLEDVSLLWANGRSTLRQALTELNSDGDVWYRNRSNRDVDARVRLVVPKDRLGINGRAIRKAIEGLDKISYVEDDDSIMIVYTSRGETPPINES